MRNKHKWLSLLLSCSLVFGTFGSLPTKAAGEEFNLALGRTATASSISNNSGPEIAVDGVTAGPQWNSENMKDGNTTPESEQTHQWLTVDLGATGSSISQIKLWYNLKVWPMVYEIQTTDDDPTLESANWEKVVRVERAPANAWVTNGTDQNIADTSANTDTITTSSSPALEKTTLKRYVRFYVEKVNTSAGGHNVNLREIEIMGTNDNLAPTLTIPNSLTNITADSLILEDNQYKLPTLNVENATVAIRGSELENVVSNTGKMSLWNIGSRKVSLLLRTTSNSDIHTISEKNVIVTVPDHSDSYPEEWFPTVQNPNEKPGVVPTIQEWYGYEGNVVLTEDSKIILKDAANIDLAKIAEITKANILEISGLDLEVITGDAPTGTNNIYIESLTDPEAYDLGEEGYLMVTNEKGVQIYAPTYTGCMFGTVTVEQILWLAEDHLSIPKGIMRDYPAYEIRGVKLDIARTPYRYQQLQDYVKIMRWYKMSEFGLHINDNDNANRPAASNDTHSGFHRLKSDTFPSLISETKHAGIPQEVVNSDYYNNNPDYQGNPTYTKQQWKDLTEYTKDMGLYLLTEIDLPGHSLLFNKYAQENPDNIPELEGGVHYSSNPNLQGRLELLDLIGENKDRATWFAETLWDEYTDPEDPTIYGDIVHIGADEYWDHSSSAINDAFARFADGLREVIQGNLGEDTKIRMWGASTSGFSTATTALNTTHEELAKNYQLDIWSLGYDNPRRRTTEGYGVINCRDAFVYGNPGRINRDVPNAEYLFDDWNPSIFGGNTNPSVGEPNLLGAKAVFWGDQSQEGMTEKDVHQRVLRGISILSEKTWNGTEEDDTFQEFELRTSHLAEGPGTEIAMEVESKSSLVLDYDFSNVSTDGTTLYDTSGNGYHANVENGSIEDGWLSFNGDTLVTTPLKTLSYPYTVSFDLKLSETDKNNNTKESSLFSGYDGRIQVAGFNGNLSADVNYFTRNFDYNVPSNDTSVKITLVGTFQATRLYVNGQFVKLLCQENPNQDGVDTGSVTTISSSVLLPLEKIGQDLHGKMANLKVYNKAMTAEEIAGTDDNKVNVAQDTHAGSNSYRGSGMQDNGVQRTSIAMKAIDGDGFLGTSGTPDGNTSERTSYWIGNQANSSLAIDLGQTREVTGVGIQWRSDGKGNNFKIETSTDGKTWQVAKEITNNQDFFQTINFDAPKNVRYVKMQGVDGTYKIQEFMVYETVDKTELTTAVTAAEELIAEKGYTFETISDDQETAFQTLILAKALKNSPLATVEEISDVSEKIEDAMTILQQDQEPDGGGDDNTDDEENTQLQAAKTELQNLIQTANSKVADEYTVDSWATFQTALTTAASLLEDTSATKEALIQAKETLASAMDALVKAENQEPDGGGSDDDNTGTGDNTGGDNSQNQKPNGGTTGGDNSQNQKPSGGTTGGDNSQNQKPNTDNTNKPTTEQIELEAAKNSLNSTIAEAEKHQKNLYTADSWNAYATVLNDAKAVFANPNSTKAQIQQATLALETAAKKLVSIETSNPDKDNQPPVETLKPGTDFTSPDGVYKFEILSDTEAAFTGISKEIKTVRIADTISYLGKTLKVTSVANKALKGKKKVTTVAIGANVTTIGTSAFEGCTGLTKVTIKKNVTKIGAKAFKNCKALKKVKLPTNLKTIGASAFTGCSKLTSLTIPKNVSKIDGKVFAKCTGLKKLVIRSTKLGAKSLAKKALSGLNKKVKIRVPKAKLKAYQQYFKKAGLTKGIKVTK